VVVYISRFSLKKEAKMRGKMISRKKMKPYGLNGFTHEPIGPQTSNDLGPINEPKSAQIFHYWPHPKKFRKFGGNFSSTIVFFNIY